MAQKDYRCEFPRCDCVGWCRYSKEGRQLAHLNRAREDCSFPDCGCRVACGYVQTICPPAPNTKPRTAASVMVDMEVVNAAVGEPCPYCGREMLPFGEPKGARLRHPVRDHIDPISKGGSNRASNLVVICHECNADKASETLVAWYLALSEANDPRTAHVAAFLKQRPPGREPADEDNDEAAA
jgi:5-methylcytosine-specific restriction endonuclease McrA